MAVKATIFKAELQIADSDRNYYQTHELTLARHASETDERMMVRVLAFVCQAGPELAFTRGMVDADEPELWEKDLTGTILTWIEVGQPDEKRILKACGRAGQVIVYTYGAGAATWWAQNGPKLARAKNLTVFNVPVASTRELVKLVQRNMELQCHLEDGKVSLADEDTTVDVEVVTLRTSTDPRSTRR